MKEKIKVTAVSYLNTKPFLYGLFQNKMDNLVEISLDIPSICAQKLKNGDAEIGLVPVAVIPELENVHIISDYCIGCDGEVKTVGIFSHVPMEEITHLYLDFHSRTSVQLAQILLKEYWQVSPKLLTATEGFIDKIGGTTAAVVIGDRAIDLLHKTPYFYDLGLYWKKHTGLPFVFAAWISTKEQSPEFIEQFNKALKTGLEYIPSLIQLLPSSRFNLNEYFTKYISYELTAPKKRALQMFLEKMDVDISFLVE